MIVLYILLGIVLFFALLFWMKVKVFVRLEDEMMLRAGYGPIVLTLVPKKKKKPVSIKDFTYKKHQKRLAKDRAAAEKKALKKKKKKEESDKKKKAKELEKKVQKLAEKHDGDKDVNKIAFIVDLVKLGLGELAAFPGYLHTDIKMLDITVASDEAASTAIKYGAISAAVYNLLEILRAKTVMHARKNAVIDVRPDFCSEKTVFHVDFSVKIRVFSFVRIGWHFLVWFVKQKMKRD